MSFFFLFLQVLLLLLALNQSSCFHASSRSLRPVRATYSMEYIPDGLTKAQWEIIKKQEAEANEVNLGAMGVKRFKSRSFEAWHKAGARHLFPVNPNKAAYQERPYMQRRGGDWEGNDLKDLGLEGKGQGVAAPRLKVDDVYEVAEKEGRLNSASIFGGLPLPWTSEAAKSNVYHPTQIKISDKEKAKAGKELSEEEMARLKALLAKPVISKKPQPSKEAVSATKEAAPPVSEVPKKKLFGLF